MLDTKNTRYWECQFKTIATYVTLIESATKAVGTVDEKLDTISSCIDECMKIVDKVEKEVNNYGSYESIVQQNAELIKYIGEMFEHSSEMDGDGFCRFCDEHVTVDSITHSKDCPYIIIKEIVEKGA